MILPRFIRLRDAPAYLGVDRHRFDAEVRPYLTEIPIGSQGIAFDRIDLDAWADEYKSRNGRPGKNKKGGKPWDANARQALILRGGVWHMEKRLKEAPGGRLRGSTGTNDLREAERFLIRKIEECGAEQHRPVGD
jgi:hypothetical protein